MRHAPAMRSLCTSCGEARVVSRVEEVDVDGLLCAADVHCGYEQEGPVEEPGGAAVVPVRVMRSTGKCTRTHSHTNL